MRKKTEDYLQNQCWIWFNNEFKNGIFVAIPNDTINAIESKRKSLTGRKKGAADVVLILPNAKVIWVEIKIHPNKQTPEQIRFQNQVEALGHRYELIYSIDEFKNLCLNNL